jgi:hypothetical protein
VGSFIETNDTLRITKAQGFPAELDVVKHLESPYRLEDFDGKVFEFTSKPKIRVYQAPPVRNFLVEDLGGKWLYWGLCFITEIHHDYIKQETAGKYKIIRLNTPEEMKQMFELTHALNKDENYF